MTKSRNQEKKIEQEFGGQRQIASGAIPGSKGDVRLDDFLVEAKRTDRTSINLKKNWIKKIEKESCAIGKRFMLHIQIQEYDLVLLLEDDLKELMGV